MSYLGATDLVGLLPGMPSITGSSTPLTMTEIEGVISRIEANVNGAAAAAGYAIPISSTATVAWAQVADAVVQGAGWRVLRRIYPNMGGPSDKSSLAAEMRDAYNLFIADLKKGNLPLVGADTDTGSAGRELPRSFPTASSIVTLGARF